MNPGWRFLVSGRWAGYLALVIVFAIVCSGLGTWQLNRRAEALTEVARIDANYDADPVPVAEALPDPDGFDADDKWLPVELTGRYLTDEEVLVRNRPYGGSVGYEILTPFRTDDGLVFAVDRGWVPPASDGGIGEVPAAPDGHVTVAARLKAGEGTIDGRTSTAEVLATINLDELAERVGEPTYTGAYGLLVSQADGELPYPSARPERDEGPHLSYALQWYVFALLAFIGLVWAARQEKRGIEEAAEGRQGAADAGAGPDGRDPASAPAAFDAETRYARRPKASKRARTKPNDADVEDEILDRR
ncbi:SURF1 family protein [Agromyces archimandritae]|uniref:SURF1-like protein n=1 Tax=Agromyces archimandritae TaxID=2781962 RepID=A0A975INY8_9MICO|nr:SURF1 family protein [Agromyces archimandritae]QTX04729.1 SURF1 family protein [Agromyces archimandritae]